MHDEKEPKYPVILVTEQNFSECLNTLITHPRLGFDTETYGLKNSDKLFSIQLCNGINSYYFNFLDTPDYLGNTAPAEYILPRGMIEDMRQLFELESITWFIHNAKFDAIRMLREAIEIKGRLHCTSVVTRILFNTIMSLNLKFCLRAHKLEVEKDDRVDACIKDNKLFTVYKVKGKATKIKDKHFDQVPFDIMSSYGCTDAAVVYDLGMDQERRLNALPTLSRVLENELQLVKTVIAMEDYGVLIDRKMCSEALDYEIEAAKKADDELEELAGFPTSTTHFLREAFDKFGYPYKIKADTGNAIFDKEALEKYDNPIAKAVKEKRKHEKYAGTYYSSFLHYSDCYGILHASPNQAGTVTGRFSYSNPNLQNVPKEDKGWEGVPFLVRSAIICRPNTSFLMIDYDQVEYRLMLDYANEKDLIESVNGGECVHQATADAVNIDRPKAKTLNFGLLYGIGKSELAKSLKMTVQAAANLKWDYFAKLPMVKNLLEGIKRRVLERGYVQNWLGRRCYLDKPNKAYIIANHLIQGGCGDIIKVAMNEIAKYLKDNNLKSKMLIQVHDELLFEIDNNELHIQKDLLSIMENVYKPMNGMRLTCGADHSTKSWGAKDKVKGFIL